ncbi:MAG: pyridoxine 5'-phosphate synthase [Bacteroidaceae bacterium]|nr:pyridoxine 5'-phosphate synthase [Bacteroidaceae bacterium]
MTKLSVNINKIATIRNARGGNNPNLVKAALDLETMGAQGITVHPRPDERHIRYADVRAIRPLLHTEFNVEGYPSEEFMNLVLEVVPDQVTLVPDKPNQITSNSGWDTKANLAFLTEITQRLHEKHIRVSIFVDPVCEMVEYAQKTGADRVELYTEPYAEAYAANREKAIMPYVEAAKCAACHGLDVNAGHDLSLENLKYFASQIPQLKEVSIGHALICDALYMGLQNTVQAYLKELRD